MKYLILALVLVCLPGCYEAPDGDSPEPPSSRPPGKETGHFLKTDTEILANLEQHLGLVAVEQGGAGRCLFHSLREQVTQAELVSIKNLFSDALQAQMNAYSTLTPDDKADLLRALAIAYEKDFIVTKNNKAKDFTALNKQDQAWVLEMAKDFYEELGHDRDKTRAWFHANKGSSAGRQILWKYIVDNRDAYWAKTSCVTNWAGSAEAIVFARLLQRPLRMYGMDLVTSLDGAELDQQGVVKPYLNYDFSYKNPPLLVYQTMGGGHYNMLKSK